MFPTRLQPIIPIRRRDLFESVKWVYELKCHGFRATAHLNGGRCQFVSRLGNEMKRFGDLAALIAKS
jgi:ATP-dependent DNA ligase